jgi:hypothetical protein
MPHQKCGVVRSTAWGSQTVKPFNKLSIVPSLLTCALAVAVIASSSSATAGQARAGAMHAPIQLLRDQNGNPVPSVARQLTSMNWSGYVLPTFQTRQKQYAVAQATWILPDVFFDGVESASLTWIGIGGFCADKKCKQIDETLIQLGTAQNAVSDTKKDYYAWYEMLPSASALIPLAVNPGDVITASLSCAGKCKNKQSWTLSMTDETTGKTWSQAVTYKSSKLSVEYIEEAPTGNGVLPLADFGTATFSQSTANSSGIDLSEGDSIIMKNPHGQTSDVSTPNSTKDGFSACFSPNSELAPCSDTSL